jgi:prepilin-type N-terminal cleavage/methylation domain-containing protein
MKRDKKGFTLIEMLIVVAIIGLLATVVIFAVARARKKAVATQMKAHVEEMMKAVEMASAEGETEVTVGTPGTGSLTGTSNSIVYVERVPSIPNDNCGYAIGDAGTCDAVPSGDFNTGDIDITDYEICAGGFENEDEIFLCKNGSCWCSEDGGCLATE